MLRGAASAKINLFLHAGAVRDDGFHELESLVVFADAADELAFAPAATLSLSIDGPFAGALQNEPDNLVLGAARTLAERMQARAGAAVALTKNLPVASGIGGGSADAAATLRGLMQLWSLAVPPETMHEIALSLGSDVPVCLVSKPAWMTGRGEHVQPVYLPVTMALVLVNPGIAVSTAQVFANLDDSTGIGMAKPDLIHSTEDLCRYLRRTRNDLEAPARAIAPVIGDVLEALSGNGALLARMSGSGATCFGIFDSDAAAGKAADSIAGSHPDWWVKATKILSSP